MLNVFCSSGLALFGENGLSRPGFDGVPLRLPLKEALKFSGEGLSGEWLRGELGRGELETERVAGERGYRGGVT